MISLRGGGLVAAFFWCARGDPGSRAGAAGPGARARPGPARAPKNAATNPPPRREIIDDSSIFGQSFNHTPNHNLNHNSNHNPKLWFIYGHRSQLLRWRTFQCQFKEGVSLHLENEGALIYLKYLSNLILKPLTEVRE